MTNNTKVSLVIPAYNEEHYIEANLIAATNQTVPFFEIIVVDNNSTDKTATIVKKFPYVTLLNEKERGLRVTRNRGMNYASGEIIGRIDADTVLDNHWCERAIKLFRDSDTDAVTGPCYYYDLPAKNTSLLFDRLGRRIAFKMGDPILYGSNMAIRRSAWEKIRGEICMKGEFFEDCDLSIHLYQDGYNIVFDNHLTVGVAARRLNDSPKVFRQTMAMFDHTFAMHGTKSKSAKTAKFIFSTSYYPLKVLHKIYDPHSQTISIMKLKNKSRVRPSSNT